VRIEGFDGLLDLGLQGGNVINSTADTFMRMPESGVE
jgi:hypothetical protein